MVNKVVSEVAREINELANGLTQSDRDRLSLVASNLVHLDAAARGIDLTSGRASSAHRT
jgi:hypothetical protein